MYALSIIAVQPHLTLESYLKRINSSYHLVVFQMALAGCVILRHKANSLCTLISGQYGYTYIHVVGAEVLYSVGGRNLYFSEA